MKRMLLLVVLIFAASHGAHRRPKKQPETLLGFAESDYAKKSAPFFRPGFDQVQATTAMSEEQSGELVKRVEALENAEPIPTEEDLTLVGFESAAARIILEGPRRRPVVEEWMDPQKRFDTPIGRTLTAELLEKDREHVPSIVLRHVPITDAQRDKFNRTVDKYHPELPKGRPTPKRKKRRRARR